jgi:alpha-beta hydrolase superfamily lysophospholipase
MFRSLGKFLRFFLRALGYGTAGATVAVIAIYVAFIESKPDLSPWHETFLDGEFTAESDVQSFTDYLALEERLFRTLDSEIYARTRPEDRRAINRYFRGSLSDPERQERNWNRTFELKTQSPVAGVLLLHGMSDSPYSLHNLGKSLHESGAWVTGLRLPGHGTIPSGLTDFRWEDMAAAVKLAMAHLRNQVGEKPLYIVGYSNGGALAVHYALETLLGTDQPPAAKIVLVSPAIGVSPAAAFAVWQARLGHLLGLEKLEWTDILPEYDPFKYNSFAVNAGDQVHRLTSRIRDDIDALGATGKLAELPPILAFQSVADATVSVSAVVETLFAKLPQGEHELVMFDINRLRELQPLIGNDDGPRVESLLAQAAPTFTLSFLTIENPTSRRVLLVQRRSQDPQLQRYPLDLEWPRVVFSLAHVALPFAPDDPLYGTEPPQRPDTLFLGDIAMRGENGVLQLTPAAMLRLRWNPFYDYLERQTLDFLGLKHASEAVPTDGSEGMSGETNVP